MAGVVLDDATLGTADEGRLHRLLTDNIVTISSTELTTVELKPSHRHGSATVACS